MRTLSLLLLALVVFSSAGYAAQTAGTPQVAKIKAQVQKRGAGEKSKVRVTLGNGTMVKGYISKIEESSFDVNGGKTGQATSISYTDVQKIQGPGLSTGAKVGIGVAVGVAIVAVVFAYRVRQKLWKIIVDYSHRCAAEPPQWRAAHTSSGCNRRPVCGTRRKVRRSCRAA